MLGLSQPTGTCSTSWQKNSPSQEHEEDFWFRTDVFHCGRAGANLPPDDVAEQVNHILLPLREKKEVHRASRHKWRDGGGFNSSDSKFSEGNLLKYLIPPQSRPSADLPREE